MASAEPRTCSIARTLDIVGEKWALLAIREVFLGDRRFDEMVRRTGAPRDTLAARLRTLVAAGILERRRYSDHPARSEYHLTEAGRDLYPVIATLMRWGDKYLAGDDGPPLVLEHSCGHRLVAQLTCQACGEPLESGQARIVSQDEPVAVCRAPRNSSISSRVVVASSGDLSSRQRPVNRGKRMASPLSGSIWPQAAVLFGDRVSSALRISSTSPGSHHTSGDCRASTRAGLSGRTSGASLVCSVTRSASVNPAPHLDTARNMSASASYAASSTAPYTPVRRPRPANAPMTTRSTVSDSSVR